MRRIATHVTRSVVCVSVCVLVTRMYCAKAAEPIEMPFVELTCVGPTNDVSNGGQDRTNLFAAARDDMSAMRPFLPNYFWTRVVPCRRQQLLTFCWFAAKQRNNTSVTFYCPHMPTGKVWTYRLLFVFLFVCLLFCKVTELSADNKGVKFCTVVHRRPGQGISHFGKLCSPEAFE